MGPKSSMGPQRWMDGTFLWSLSSAVGEPLVVGMGFPENWNGAKSCW